MSNLAEDFAMFHEANPHVYKMFSDYTRQAINKKFKHFGARMIWERMRWYTAIDAPDLKTFFKLNDHYIAFYSRLWMKDHPEHQGFFRIRGPGWQPPFKPKKSDPEPEWLL